MPDYIYLLENRLSADQQSALRHLREAAREAGTILFLTGDAVRELTSGHTVRSLEVAVHGNALKLRSSVEQRGAKVWGEDETGGALFLCFPGTVRVDLLSTHRSEYPKPGKPVYHAASIQEDLRQRDFTVNAMAISLNEGSFGLLMDPTNGAADIETGTLRLVSNYGFLEEPSLLIRATRYLARLGWEMDPKTMTRYNNAKEEGVIEHLSALSRSRELEQIGHEEQGLKVMQALEAEGWMEVLFPAWNSAKADEVGLTALHDLAIELLLQGVQADMSAAQMRMLTAKLAAKDLAALKKLMLRPGFVAEWNSLDALAASFAKELLAKENAMPSVSYKLFLSYDPEAVLWLGFTSKDEAVKERFQLFLKGWPEVRQRIPHALLQEMRITAELPAYKEIVQSIFLQLLDGKLGTTEEMRAFLEPYSPPALPPKETIKRPRGKRGESKMKDDSFDEDEEESEDDLDDEEDLDDIGGEDDDLGLHLPKIDLGIDLSGDTGSITTGDEEGDDEEGDDEEAEPKPVAVKRASKTPAEGKAAKTPSEPAKPSALKISEAKSAAPKTASKPKSKPLPSKPAPAQAKKAIPAAKSAAKPTVKPAAKPASKPAAKPATKVPVKAAAKTPAKPAAKAVVAPAPAKKNSPPAAVRKTGPAGKPSAAKKPVTRPGKKH
jgi:tRNA nucleotidyltransferase/poly(A) polymerase